MNYSVNEHLVYNIVEVIFADIFSSGEQLEIQSIIEASSLYRTGAALLLDMTRVALEQFSNDDIKLISAQAAAIGHQISGRRCAIVVSGQAHHFGIARMWGTLTEDSVQATLRVFQNREEALQWLSPGS